jgi:uncharacterized membrane protein HdeD (DUF308 family)
LNLIRVMPAKGQDMSTSIFLAKLIGPILLVVGIGLILNAASYRSLADEFLKSPALIFLSGWLTMPAGLAIVLTHNVWAADWRVLITLLGWVGIVAGVIRLSLPAQAAGWGRKMIANPLAMKFSAALYLVLGAVFCFYGYFR